MINKMVKQKKKRACRPLKAN